MRVFGGFDFGDATPDSRSWTQLGYEKGVPMGGDLPAPAAASAPSFMIAALKDPNSANLDQVQLVKGWLDAGGKTHDKIYDVAWSGEREPGPNGGLPAVGNTVDLTTATYTNSIGSPELIGSWTDAAFDPKQYALYYVRVLEIPTPRWSTFGAVRAGLPLLDGMPATIQERAWSSPIWYSPSGQ